jgi:hypothetical protein
MINPVTAITIFFPIVDRQNVRTRFIGPIRFA